jgi:hypothetical protein
VPRRNQEYLHFVKEMKKEGTQDTVALRMLWMGTGFNIGSPAQQEVAHEEILESGLLRLENTRFDFVIARLPADVDQEFFIDLLQRGGSAGAPVFIQLEDQNVTTAALLAHNGAVGVYGPDASSDEILCAARLIAKQRP